MGTCQLRHTLTVLPATPAHPAAHHPHSSLQPQNVSKLLEGSRFSYGTNHRRNRVVLLLSQLLRPIAESQTPRVHPLLSPTYYLHPCKTPLAPPPIPGILSKCSVGGGRGAWGMMEMKGSRVLLLWGRQHMEATKSLGRPTADMWVVRLPVINISCLLGPHLTGECQLHSSDIQQHGLYTLHVPSLDTHQVPGP